jgi:hypothetical protein
MFAGPVDFKLIRQYNSFSTISMQLFKDPQRSSDKALAYDMALSQNDNVHEITQRRLRVSFMDKNIQTPRVSTTGYTQQASRDLHNLIVRNMNQWIC